MAKIKTRKGNLITCSTEKKGTELVTIRTADAVKPSAKKSKINAKALDEKEEYFLASMFPSDDVMRKVYSIMRKLENV